MGYINFDKTQLINLEYSLNKEMIRSNRAGSFSCTTILGCNTRKYHGLLICPQPQLDGEQHILLSKVDETVIQRDAAFNLGVNKYPGVFHPKGHKYVRYFSADLIPVITYRVGGVVLTRETVFITGKEMVLIRYTLEEATSPTTLRIQPFLAFRQIHKLSKRNIDVNTRYEPVANGIRMKLYDGYPDLYMQISKKRMEYIHSPDWFDQLEYIREAERGYDPHEDLFVPGFFDIPIKKGEQVIFAASTSAVASTSMDRLFSGELSKRTPRDTYLNCLHAAAEQFVNKTTEGITITPGYPWHGYSGRFTWIALPGLSLAFESKDLCETVIGQMTARMKGPMFPESYVGREAVYNGSDTSLWFIRSLQLCYKDTARAKVWKKFGHIIENILEGYASGLTQGVSLHENGLLFIDPSVPFLTWMNASVNGRCVTPRYGYVVEVNALWYHAVCFAAELARAAGNKSFVSKWSDIAQRIKHSFIEELWDNEKKYLADYSYNGKKDSSIRPNQLIAASLSYSPLSANQKHHVLDICIKQLLTPRGLRTLSPGDMHYKGHYAGDAYARDAALHQGTVWAWLMGILADVYLELHGEEGKLQIRKLFGAFEDTMSEGGIGTVSELFEGDAPHQASGALSFAASVSELLRMEMMSRPATSKKPKKTVKE